MIYSAAKGIYLEHVERPAALYQAAINLGYQELSFVKQIAWYVVCHHHEIACHLHNTSVITFTFVHNRQD